MPNNNSKRFDSEDRIAPFATPIRELLKQFEEENKYYRSFKLREWKRKDLYWHNIQYIYWADELEGFGDIGVAGGTEQDEERIEARVVNVYRAHGEAIVAALSGGIPTVKFFPEDADDTSHLDTAKAWSKGWDLIKRRNKMPLLFVKALWTLYNQDFVACWNQNIASPTYGIIEKPVFKTEDYTIDAYNCPHCGYEMQQDEVFCQQCGMEVIPQTKQVQKQRQVQVGTEEVPKSSEKLEICGPLNVNIPFWLEDFRDTTHLIHETEYHYAFLRKEHPQFREKITARESSDVESRWARTPFMSNTTVQGLTTRKKLWLTPIAYEAMDNDEHRKMFQKQFPVGCCATVIGNDLVVEIYEESLFDRWTLTKSPLSRHVHADSMGNTVMDIQDLTNDVVNLTVQTIEYGISETFADPDTLDFDAYKENPNKPGSVTPAKAEPGARISDKFFMTRPATLSKEVKSFADDLMQYGQFSSGAFPSIYGGNISGSRTVGEYDRSRSQALQRLSIHYAMLKEFVLEVAEKSVKSFMNNMRTDERVVVEQNGQFLNDWIYKKHLQGRVGKVEGEVSEVFPVAWQQKIETIMKLLELQNETISDNLLHPQNAIMMKNLMGLPELYVQGEGARNKQWGEIYEMLQQQAIPLDEMQPEIGYRSSLPTEDTDDDNVEYEVCMAFINGDKGQYAKQNNRAGYYNVVLHAKEHLSKLQMQGQPKPTEGASSDQGEKQNGGRGNNSNRPE